MDTSTQCRGEASEIMIPKPTKEIARNRENERADAVRIAYCAILGTVYVRDTHSRDTTCPLCGYSGHCSGA